MKNSTLLTVFLLTSFSFVLHAQINVSGSTGANGSYTTLNAAFMAINGTAQTGNNIVIAVTGNTNEGTAIATLNAGTWNSLLIQPSGGTARNITGNPAGLGSLIDLNGADYVTIDGLNSGGNSLTITNTTISSTATSATIRFKNGARRNTITNCFVNGGHLIPSNAEGGTISFSSDGVSSGGNDSNTVSNCDIGPINSASLPNKAVSSRGSSNGNDYNVISNNNIHDYNLVGVFIYDNTSNMTVSGNRFYLTNTLTSILNSHGAIGIESATAHSCTISNNIIGFASSAGTGVYTCQASANGKLRMIYVNSHSATPSTIQGNTITAISMSGPTYGSGVNTPFSGIYVNTTVGGGQVNIIGNTIGSATNAGAINYTTSNTLAQPSEVRGVFSSSINAYINNCQVGGINLSSSTGGQINFYGLCGNESVATTTNTIMNCTVGFENAPIIASSTHSSSMMAGIRNVMHTATITGNTVAWLQCNFPNTAIGTFSCLNGITVENTTSGGGSNISQNTVHSLSNTEATVATCVQGITINTNTTGNHTIINNNIHSLSLSSTNTLAEISGIYNVAGSFETFTNNMIRLGFDASGISISSGLRIFGIKDASTTNVSFYHNSIYIGGNATGGTSNTFSLYSTAASGTRLFLNNVFMNARNNTGSTGKHYAIRVGGTAPNAAGLNSDGNDFYVTGSGGFIGLYNSIDRVTLNDWKTATGYDQYSLSADPNFANATGSSALGNLHVNSPTAVESNGTALPSVVTDIDGQTRSALSPADIGADAGNFVSSGDIAPPIVTYSLIPNNCTSGDRTLNATITDGTGVPVAGSFVPRIYFRRNSGAYFSSAGVFNSGTSQNGNWTFTISAAVMGGLIGGDSIYYFIIAQDIGSPVNLKAYPNTALVASDVNTVSNYPSNPNFCLMGHTLNGTYTVGSGGFFNTLTAAVNAYNNACITGPVVFSLISSNYPSETFPISINSNVYASSVNTLTIKPASGVTAVISGNSSSAILRIKGADYVTIDGSNSAGGNTRDLSFTQQNTGATTTIIWLSPKDATDGANNNTIKNCLFSGGLNTGTHSCISSCGSTGTFPQTSEAQNNNNTYQNNLTKKSQYGIFVAGPVGNESGLVVKDNEAGSSVLSEKHGFRGMHFQNQQGMLIDNNTIKGVVSYSNATINGGGIFAGGTLSGGTITRNKISDLKNLNTAGGPFGGGMYGIIVNSTSSAINLTIANNFISDITGRSNATNTIDANGYGIALYNGDGFNIWHNTINMNTNQPANGNASALWINSIVGGTGINLRNNVLINSQTAGNQRYVITCLQPNNAVFSAIDNNDYYTTGTNLALIGSTNCTNLASVQTNFGSNLNSVNILPVFTSSTDLHLPHASNTSLDNLGTPLGIPNDIDLDTRSLTTPDMGADEFSPASATAEINLSGNSTSISDGDITPSSTDHTDFGIQSVCAGTIQRTFTIQNTGSVTLNISGVVIGGTNASNFSIVTAPSSTVAAGGSTTLVVSFNPSASGIAVATITVNNDDADEAVYDFSIQGSGTVVSASANTQTNVSCNGVSDGAASVTVTGGITPITFAWSPSGGSAANAGGLSAGSYTCTITDANGCSATQNFTITQPSALLVTASTSTATICSGTTITLTSTGATTYTWMPGSLTGSSVNVSPASGTTYTVTGTTAGCSNTATVSVTVNTTPTVTANASLTILCNGASATLSSSGASTYTWMPGSLSGASVVVTPSTTTTYTVSGSTGSCTDTETVTVTVNSLPNVTASASSTVTICSGNNITLSANGASTYTWMPGSLSGASVSVSPASSVTYTVTGTSAQGCSSTQTVSVSVSPIISSNIASQTNVSCFGANNGAASINASGGSGTLTYTWSPSGGNAAGSSGLSAGNYTCTIADAIGCTSQQTLTITSPAAISSSVSSLTNVSCNGGNNGSATVSASGGSGSLLYNWTPSGGIFSTASGLIAGTYTCTVTDANLCAHTQTVSITQPSVISVNVSSSTNATCGNANGTGSVSVTGGNGSYLYSWLPSGGNAASATGLAAGAYTVNVSDVNGCQGSTVVNISNAGAATLSLTSQNNVTCNGANNGSVTINATGGSGALTYNWSPGNPAGDGTNNVSGLNSGNWSCVVTDGAGCTSSISVVITEPSAISSFISSQTNVLCNGAANGAATVNSTGGTGTHTYLWSSGSTSNTQNGLAAGSYSVTITDVNGCISSQIVNITQPAALNVNITSINAVSCFGFSDGSASINASGGSGTLSYSWAPSGGVLSSASALSAGIYTITVSDVNLCSTTATLTITEPSAVIVNANASNTSVCQGQVVTLNGSGTATTYTWTGGITDGMAFNPAAGATYIVTGTDVSGCSSSDTIAILVHPLPVVTASVSSQTVCAGSSVTFTGGGNANTYTWSGGVGNGISYIINASGYFTVTGTNLNGCSDTAGILVSVNPAPVVSLGPDVAQCSGTVLLDAGNPGDNYSWSEGSSGQTLLVTMSGIYWADVANAANCVSRDSVQITINSNPSVSLGNDSTQCGGTIVLDAQNPGATYLWTGGSTGQTLTASASGIYYVTVTYSGGCSASDSVNLNILSLPAVSFSLPNDTVCENSGTISLSGTPAGGVFTGTGVSGNTLVVGTSGIVQVNYSYTDINGCSSSEGDTLFVEVCMNETFYSGELYLLKLFPNPTPGEIKLHLETEQELSGVQIIVTNLIGQQVSVLKPGSIRGQAYDTEIDLSGMENGVYFITVTSNEMKTVSKKIILQQ